MEAKPASFWRIISRHTAKPLYFAPVLWKPWNTRKFSDYARMRFCNLIFEIANVAQSRTRKISLVSRTSSVKLNTNVGLIINKYKVDKPEDRGTKPLNTVGLALWSLESGLIPPVPEFESNDEVLRYLNQWDAMNDGIPKKIAKDIHKKVRYNQSIREEMKEEDDYNYGDA